MTHVPSLRAALALVLALAACGCVSSKKYQRLAADKAAVGKELADTQKARDEARGNAAALESRVTELQAASARVSLRADQAEAERDRLSTANAEMSKSLTAKQDELSGLVSRLQGELNDSKKSLAQARTKASDYESRSQELAGKLDETVARAGQAEKERDQLKQANADLSKSLAANRDELSKQVSSLSDGKRALEARIAELSKAADELKAKQDRELAQTKATYETLMSELQGEVQKGQVQITQMAGKLSVNVADTIFFDSGKAEIKDSGRKVLLRVGDILAHLTDKQVRIEGHTDNVPIRGALKEKYPTNWELSTARATMVARFLQERAGMDPSLLTAAGYGPYRPIASNDDEEGRAKNRRIEIVLIDKELGRKAP